MNILRAAEFHSVICGFDCCGIIADRAPLNAFNGYVIVSIRNHNFIVVCNKIKFRIPKKLPFRETCFIICTFTYIVILADKLNGAGYTTSGRVIADRATVINALNVAGDFTLKSDTNRTIGGFTGIKTGSVYTSYLATKEIIFYEDFGLTVSGELMMSTNPPIKFGTWGFPSTTPPSFSALVLSRAGLPAAPTKKEFRAILTNDWQTFVPQQSEGGL